jgi:hypothetical protein
MQARISQDQRVSCALLERIKVHLHLTARLVPLAQVESQQLDQQPVVHLFLIAQSVHQAMQAQ